MAKKKKSTGEKTDFFLNENQNKFVIMCLIGLSAFSAILIGFGDLFSRSADTMSIVSKVTVSAVEILFAWIFKNKMTLSLRIISMMPVLYVWLLITLIPEWLVFILETATLISVMFGAVKLIAEKCGDKISYPLFFAWLFTLIIKITIKSNQYDLVDVLPFWWFALIVAVGVFIVIYRIVSKHYNVDKVLSSGMCICYVIVVLAFLITNCVIENANCIFSPEPEAVTAVIEDKDITYTPKRYGRSRRNYIFVLDAGDDEISISVNEAYYDEYNEGDKITLLYYEGAFGKPFYIFAEN